MPLEISGSFASVGRTLSWLWKRGGGGHKVRISHGDTVITQHAHYSASLPLEMSHTTDNTNTEFI